MVYNVQAFILLFGFIKNQCTWLEACDLDVKMYLNFKVVKYKSII